MKHNPYLRLFTRDIEGSPKINALSMAASGLYFRLLNRFNEPPMPGSLALHEWEVHHRWKRSLTQQCLANPNKYERLQYFARYLSRIFQWKSADILKSLQELYFFGIVVVEDDRLIQPRMYRDNGYKLQKNDVSEENIDPATGALNGVYDEEMNIGTDGKKKTDEKNSKKNSKKTAQKNNKKNTKKNTVTHARGHSNENEYENNNIDNNSNSKQKTEKTDIEIKQVPTFDMFWDAYDKKVERPKSEALWDKLSISEKVAVMDYLPLYKESQPEKRFRKNPTTFLRNRSWEDEIIPSESTSPVRGKRMGSVPVKDNRPGRYIKDKW